MSDKQSASLGSKQVKLSDVLKVFAKGSTIWKEFSNKNDLQKVICILHLSSGLLEKKMIQSKNLLTDLQNNEEEQVRNRVNDIKNKKIKPEKIATEMRKWQPKIAFHVYKELVKSEFPNGLLQKNSFYQLIQWDDNMCAKGTFYSETQEVESIIDALTKEAIFTFGDAINLMKNIFQNNKHYSKMPSNTVTDIFAKVMISPQTEKLGGNSAFEMMVHSLMRSYFHYNHSQREPNASSSDESENLTELESHSQVKELFLTLNNGCDFTPPDSLKIFFMLRTAMHENGHVTHPTIFFNAYDRNAVEFYFDAMFKSPIAENKIRKLCDAMSSNDIGELYKRAIYFLCKGTLLTHATAFEIFDRFTHRDQRKIPQINKFDFMNQSTIRQIVLAEFLHTCKVLLETNQNFKMGSYFSIYKYMLPVMYRFAPENEEFSSRIKRMEQKEKNQFLKNGYTVILNAIFSFDKSLMKLLIFKVNEFYLLENGL